MTDEINEIIRVLQLTTYDEDEWDADNLTVMKKAQNAIEGKMQAAHDWLEVGTFNFKIKFIEYFNYFFKGNLRSIGI